MARSRQQVDIVLRGRDEVSGKLKAVNGSMDKLKTALKAFAAIMAAKKLADMGTAGATFNHQLVQINKNTDEAIRKIKAMQDASGGVFSKTDIANFLATQKRLGVELEFSGAELRKLDAQFTTLGLDGGAALKKMVLAVAKGKAGFLQTSVGIQNVSRDLDRLAKSEGVASSAMLSTGQLRTFMIDKIKGHLAGLDEASSTNMGAWEAFDAALSDAMLALSRALAPLGPAFQGVAEVIEAVAEAAAPLIVAVGELLHGAFKVLFAIMTPVVETLKAMGNLISWLLTPLKQFVGIVGAGFEQVSGLIGGTLSGLGDAWDKMLGRTNALSARILTQAIELDNEIKEVINTRRVETQEVKRTFEAVQALTKLEKDHASILLKITKTRSDIRIKALKARLKITTDEQEIQGIRADLELLVSERSEQAHKVRLAGIDKEREKLNKLRDERIKQSTEGREDYQTIEGLLRRVNEQTAKAEERAKAVRIETTFWANEQGEVRKTYVETSDSISEAIQTQRPVIKALELLDRRRAELQARRAKIVDAEAARINEDMIPGYQDLTAAAEASLDLAKTELTTIDQIVNKEMGITREVKRQAVARRDSAGSSQLSLKTTTRELELQAAQTDLARALLAIKYKMQDLPVPEGDDALLATMNATALLHREQKQALDDIIGARGDSLLAAERELAILGLATGHEKEIVGLKHQEQDIREAIRRTQAQTARDIAAHPDMAPQLEAAQSSLERELGTRLQILAMTKDQLETQKAQADAQERLQNSLAIWSSSASAVSSYNQQAGAVLATTSGLIEAEGMRTKAGKLSTKAYTSGIDAIGSGLASFMSSQKEQAAVLAAMEAAKAVASFPDFASMAAHTAAATMFGLIAGGVISTGGAPSGAAQERDRGGGGGGPSTVIFNMGEGMIAGSPVELARSLGRATDIAMRGGIHGGAV